MFCFKRYSLKYPLNYFVILINLFQLELNWGRFAELYFFKDSTIIKLFNHKIIDIFVYEIPIILSRTYKLFFKIFRTIPNKLKFLSIKIFYPQLRFISNLTYCSTPHHCNLSYLFIFILFNNSWPRRSWKKSRSRSGRIYFNYSKQIPVACDAVHEFSCVHFFMDY